jgi:hypothetical protein
MVSGQGRSLLDLPCTHYPKQLCFVAWPMKRVFGFWCAQLDHYTMLHSCDCHTPSAHVPLFHTKSMCLEHTRQLPPHPRCQCSRALSRLQLLFHGLFLRTTSPSHTQHNTLPTTPCSQTRHIACHMCMNVVVVDVAPCTRMHAVRTVAVACRDTRGDACVRARKRLRGRCVDRHHEQQQH